MGVVMVISFIIIFIMIFIVGWFLFPFFFESPKYIVLKKEKKFEIREYSKALVAMTRQEGCRETSLRKGFSELVKYIGGSSKEKTKISMTVPVIQERDINHKSWRILFFMPEKFLSSNHPNPLSKNTFVRNIVKKKIAIIKFNGSPNDKLLKEKEVELVRWIKSIGVVYDINEIRYAFYHGPMTPGFLRKNEVHIPIKNQKI